MIAALLHWLGWTAPRIPTPCPYCPNPDRDDNGNAIGGSRAGNCQWVEDKRVSRGSDAPCVTDNYGTLRGD